MGNLEAASLSKTYKHRKVLDGFSFTLKPGEVLGLLGPNGAGKTTALEIIMGFIAQEQGHVMLDGEEISGLPPYKRVRKGIGYLPQETCLFDDLSALDNVIAVMELLKWDKKTRKQDAVVKLGEFGLEHVAGTKAKSLSGGEKRRLEIILSLLPGPRYLLWDEPFTGVDPKQIRELQGIIQTLVGKGIGMVIVDHNLTEVIKRTDRLILLYDGKKSFEGNTGDFLNSELVKEVYL